MFSDNPKDEGSRDDSIRQRIDFDSKRVFKERSETEDEPDGKITQESFLAGTSSQRPTFKNSLVGNNQGRE